MRLPRNLIDATRYGAELCVPMSRNEAKRDDSEARRAGAEGRTMKTLKGKEEDLSGTSYPKVCAGVVYDSVRVGVWMKE